MREEGRRGPFRESPYPFGHKDLLLFFPPLLFRSDTCFILCKLRQFFQPPMARILHSCFYLQDIARERGKGRYEMSKGSHLQMATMMACVCYTALYYITVITDFKDLPSPQTVESNPSALNFPYCPCKYHNRK